ncbi:MAG: hypothetical protein RIR00_1014, partial [Pseudomonadota bacterium]
MERVTELEHRLASMRTFMGMLLAHLEDNGLIDRNLLEEDFWKVQATSHLCERSSADMKAVFAIADTVVT